MPINELRTGGSGGTTTLYPKVNTYSDLPDPTLNSNKIYIVLNSIGDFLINRKESGMYYSDGISWELLGDVIPYFNDDNFEIYNNDGNAIKFNADLLTDKRTITMRDSDIDLNNIDSLQFDTNQNTPLEEGQLGWNSDNQTLEVGLSGGGINSIGQELEFRATADENILNGQVVYISGSTGANIKVSLVNSSNFDTACKTIAVATEDILINHKGRFTTFGIVRNINTSSFNAGDILYVDINGNITNVKPGVGSVIVEIGYVGRIHASEGEIFVSIKVNSAETCNMITKEPTGFYQPENVVVTYNNTNRTVSLSGDVYAFFRGKKVNEIHDGFISDPHPTTLDKAYFLIYNGTTFEWVDLTTGNLEFSNILIAYVYYGATDKWALRECHGLMQWQNHRADHYNIGTYTLGGGNFSDFTLNSTTAVDRRLSIQSTTMFDEDVKTTNSSLPSGSYTQYYLSETGTPNFIKNATDIVPLLNTNPYYNEWNGSAFIQTLMPNNSYMVIWIIAIPTTADSESQHYRYIFAQDQFSSSSLSAVQGRTPQDYNKGQLNSLTPESVFIGKIIIRYTANNWTLTEVNTITGNKANQTQQAGGGFLSSVSSDKTLNGVGTPNDQLSINTTITRDYTLNTLLFKDEVVVNSNILYRAALEFTTDETSIDNDISSGNLILIGDSVDLSNYVKKTGETSQSIAGKVNVNNSTNLRRIELEANSSDNPSFRMFRPAFGIQGEGFTIELEDHGFNAGPLVSFNVIKEDNSKSSFIKFDTTNIYLDKNIKSDVINTSGSVKISGNFYTGTTDPTNTTRLNYDGNFHVNNITSEGSLTAGGGISAGGVVSAPGLSEGLLDSIFDIVHPVDEIYVQYPFQKTPSVLYNGRGTWTDISNVHLRNSSNNLLYYTSAGVITTTATGNTALTYKDCFFRVEGAINTATVGQSGGTVFEYARQLDQMQRITGDVQWRDNGGLIRTDTVVGSTSGAFKTGSTTRVNGPSPTSTGNYADLLIDTYNTATVMRVSSATTGETRSVNMSIRIWKRTA